METAMGCAAVFPTLATPTTSKAKACLTGAVMAGAAGHFAGHHGNLGSGGGFAHSTLTRQHDPDH